MRLAINVHAVEPTLNSAYPKNDFVIVQRELIVVPLQGPFELVKSVIRWLTGDFA